MQSPSAIQIHLTSQVEMRIQSIWHLLFIAVLCSLAVAKKHPAHRHKKSRHSKAQLTRPSHRSSKSDSPCSRKLAQIVYAPEDCQARYLARLGQRIVRATPYLFASLSTSIQFYLNFQAQYGVTLYVFDAFGTQIFPTPQWTSPQSITNPLFAMNRNYARQAIVPDGSFTRVDNPSYGQYMVTVHSRDDQILFVQILQPSENAALFC